MDKLNSRVLLVAYADDTSVIVSNKSDVLTEQFNDVVSILNFRFTELSLFLNSYKCISIRFHNYYPAKILLVVIFWHVPRNFLDKNVSFRKHNRGIQKHLFLLIEECFTTPISPRIPQFQLKVLDITHHSKLVYKIYYIYKIF